MCETNPLENIPCGPLDAKSQCLGEKPRSSTAPVKLELLKVSIKLLELFQLEVLAKEEISAMNSYSAHHASRLQLQEFVDIKQTTLRICLYYETAIHLSLSIFDISSHVTSNILKLIHGSAIEAESFEEQLSSTLIPEADPILAGHLATLAPYYDLLVVDAQNAVQDVAEILANTGEAQSREAHDNSTSLTAHDLESRIRELCALVRKYSNFLGEHFTRLL